MKESFENLKKTISEGADVVTKKAGEVIDVVSKKTEQTIEIQKKKDKIRTLKRGNSKDFADMGKMIYDKFKKGEIEDEALKEICEAIAEREGEIGSAEKDIADIKGLDVCKACGAYIAQDAAFCPKCGAKVSEEPEFEEN